MKYDKNSNQYFKKQSAGSAQADVTSAKPLRAAQPTLL